MYDKRVVRGSNYSTTHMASVSTPPNFKFYLLFCFQESTHQIGLQDNK